MPNYKLNNTVPEPDRSMDNLGFDTMGTHPNESFPAGTSHNQPFTFADEVVDSANTVKRQWPTPAGGDYGLRKY